GLLGLVVLGQEGIGRPLIGCGLPVGVVAGQEDLGQLLVVGVVAARPADDETADDEELAKVFLAGDHADRQAAADELAANPFLAEDDKAEEPDPA
ncbi:MAG TPA: hypothetical protein VFC81_00765, partial [Verrucomicrobiae bacterium]|nr:hypothetical protein [Verrucomicrobiae bacterium]